MLDKYKVTYYFGAGASHKNKALPTVAVFADDLMECASYVAGYSTKVSNPRLVEWVRDLEWLSIMGAKFNTVDTYAMWCSRHDKQALHRLKLTLSLFFSIQQFVRGRRDSRYNQFITEIIDDNLKFPENVKIINWNYDNQVQLACDLNDNKREQYAYRAQGSNRHIRGIVYYYPTMSDIQRPEEFDMVHMNGIAGYYNDDFSKSNFYNNINGEIENIDDLIKEYHKTQNARPIFNFAFEKTEKGREIDDRIEIAKRIAEGTHVLVIVGYSFPPVNFPIDKEVMDIMKDKLAKVYIQSPGLTPDSFRRRFDINESTIIEVVDQLYSFHMALEYNQPKPVLRPPRTTLIRPRRN